MEEKKQQVMGIYYGIIAYLIWGILPLYWKALEFVQPDEILAHRIFWSFLFMIIYLILLKKWSSFVSELKTIIHKPAFFYSIIFSGILISGNWFIYIWAVNHDHVLETSLGYYINPLITVLLGIIVLKERLSLLQFVSFLLAGIGVFVLSLEYGKIPWVALALAFSFGFYGLVKKKVNISAATGLTVETMAVTPIAIFYFIYLFFQGEGSFIQHSLKTDVLLIGTGVITAIPLLLFAQAAKKIPLSMVGFLQYIAPTMTLLLGVFVFHEPFTKMHAIAFGFIWLALSLYTISTTKIARKYQPKVKKERTIA